MKLLTPVETITQTERQNFVNNKRTETISKTLETAKKELELVYLEKQKALEGQAFEQEKLRKEIIEYEDKLKVFRQEVRLLEERKKNARTPLESEWDRLADINDYLNIEKDKLEKRKEEEEEKIELLQEKLSELEERESNIELEAKRQLAARQGIENQKEQIRLEANDFNKTLEKSLARVNKKERELNKEKALLQIKLDDFVDKQKEVALKEKGYADQERAIKDKYDTLQKTIAEVNKKYNLKL